jgi:hypothetical protein
MTTRALSGRWRWTREGMGAIPVGNAAAGTDGTGGYAGPREQVALRCAPAPSLDGPPRDYCTVCGFKASPITRTGTSFCLDHAIEDYAKPTRARHTEPPPPPARDEPRYPRACPCGTVFYVHDPRVRVCRKRLCNWCVSERNRANNRYVRARRE